MDTGYENLFHAIFRQAVKDSIKEVKKMLNERLGLVFSKKGVEEIVLKYSDEIALKVKRVVFEEADDYPNVRGIITYRKLKAINGSIAKKAIMEYAGL